ncbi:unnamed protein product, partial [Ranitomeya imitator]
FSCILYQLDANTADCIDERGSVTLPLPSSQPASDVTDTDTDSRRDDVNARRCLEVCGRSEQRRNQEKERAVYEVYGAELNVYEVYGSELNVYEVYGAELNVYEVYRAEPCVYEMYGVEPSRFTDNLEDRSWWLKPGSRIGEDCAVGGAAGKCMVGLLRPRHCFRDTRIYLSHRRTPWAVPALTVQVAGQILMVGASSK